MTYASEDTTAVRGIPQAYLPALRAAEQIIMRHDPGYAAALAQLARLVAEDRIVIMPTTRPAS